MRPLSTATTVTPVPNLEDVPSTVELDKLYKRVELEMRGIDPAVLLSYSWFCVAAASHLGIEVTKKLVENTWVDPLITSNPACESVDV